LRKINLSLRSSAALIPPLGPHYCPPRSIHVAIQRPRRSIQKWCPAITMAIQRFTNTVKVSLMCSQQIQLWLMTHPYVNIKRHDSSRQAVQIISAIIQECCSKQPI